MKIALFYNLNFGGAKRVVAEHAKGLSKKGHIVDLYSVNSEKDIFDPTIYANRTFEYEFKIGSSARVVSDYKNFFKLKSLHKKIAAEIDGRSYDIVLVHPDKFTQAPFVLRYLKTKSVYYCQEPLRIAYEYSLRLKEKVNFIKYVYEETTRQYRKIVDRDNVRAANFTIASCFHVRERMIESYEVYPKIVYCGVDHSIFRPIKTKKLNQVFFVGSPNVWEDGYDLAKKAVQLIPSEHRPKLKIVSWRKSNGERLSESELVKIYNQSIATISTSRLETFGLVPLESMSCGVPDIATSLSGHRETIINGKTGFLVDLEPKEIADKIMFLVSNPAKTREIGIKAREHIEKNWTWDIIINDLDRTLRSFLAK